MKIGHWRRIAMDVVAKVIEKVGTADIGVLRAALREAYPFGERKYFPYKVWCHEVNRQIRGEVLGGRKDDFDPEAKMPLFEDEA